MKRIGILGGMGPESTIEYYKEIISLSREKWEYKCPEILIYNLNEEEWATYIEVDKDLAKAKSLLSDAINALYRAGADFVVMASNTPHIFFDELVKTSPVPLLNIAEETAKEAKRKEYSKLGLLGTKIVMQGEFYKVPFEKLKLQVIVPDLSSQDYIHKKIVEELVRGIFKDKTKADLLGIVNNFVKKSSINAVILGCTELPLVISQSDLEIPVLNTLKIYAKAALEYSLAD
jgi:aspartate racemase